MVIRMVTNCSWGRAESLYSNAAYVDKSAERNVRVMRTATFNVCSTNDKRASAIVPWRHLLFSLFVNCGIFWYFSRYQTRRSRVSNCPSIAIRFNPLPFFSLSIDYFIDEWNNPARETRVDSRSDYVSLLLLRIANPPVTITLHAPRARANARKIISASNRRWNLVRSCKFVDGWHCYTDVFSGVDLGLRTSNQPLSTCPLTVHAV